jgi:hypothetical protein
MHAVAQHGLAFAHEHALDYVAFPTPRNLTVQPEHLPEVAGAAYAEAVIEVDDAAQVQESRVRDVFWPVSMHKLGVNCECRDRSKLFPKHLGFHFLPALRSGGVRGFPECCCNCGEDAHSRVRCGSGIGLEDVASRGAKLWRQRRLENDTRRLVTQDELPCMFAVDAGAPA